MNTDCFGLNWPGKEECPRVAQEQRFGTFKPNREESVNFDTTGNLFIEADNLEALKFLQEFYLDTVKMVYIDPPYNIAGGFGYSDSFGGHSNWLNMMYPRLYLARSLLRDDGVIFISIDDKEVANLKLLCNEIFGERNFVAKIVWQKKCSAVNCAKGFSRMHDYVLVYRKSDSFKRNLLPRTARHEEAYNYDDNDGKGPWRSESLRAPWGGPSAKFPIINPNTGEEFLPPSGSSWSVARSTIEKWLEEDRIIFGKDGKGAPRRKKYLSEVQQGVVPTTWWSWEDAGYNGMAKREVKALFGSVAVFDTPKPVKLILKMLRIATSKQDIVLDFFAGSATTAHAVMELNAEDGGNRKFIMVQLPEKTKEDSEAFKAGYENIADIAKERIRRAGKKIQDEHNAKLDIGFKTIKYHLPLL